MQEPENPDLNDPDIIKAKLNMETARIPWSQLQRFFAAGRTRLISKDGDLVDVALQFALDNSEQIAAWIEQGIISDVDDATALDWVERDAEVWAVVAAPWILVQADTAA